MSATVDAYLAAINTPKKRGRKVSKAALEQRLTQARSRARAATGVDKVLAAQAVHDLQARLAEASSATATDVESLESAFVKVAKAFSEKCGIRWETLDLALAAVRRARPRTTERKSDLSAGLVNGSSDLSARSPALEESSMEPWRSEVEAIQTMLAELHECPLSNAEKARVEVFVIEQLSRGVDRCDIECELVGHPFWQDADDSDPSDVPF